MTDERTRRLEFRLADRDNEIVALQARIELYERVRIAAQGVIDTWSGARFTSDLELESALAALSAPTGELGGITVPPGLAESMAAIGSTEGMEVHVLAHKDGSVTAMDGGPAPAAPNGSDVVIHHAIGSTEEAQDG